MVTTAALAKRLAHAVGQHLPESRCFSCLAMDLDAPEPTVRSAAQTLMFGHSGRETTLFRLSSHGGNTRSPIR
jgi:hypothetical protein